MIINSRSVRRSARRNPIYCTGNHKRPTAAKILASREAFRATRCSKPKLTINHTNTHQQIDKLINEIIEIITGNNGVIDIGVDDSVEQQLLKFGESKSMIIIILF